MIYIILFIIFFLLSIIYDYNKVKKNRSYFYWLSVSILIIVAGFRYRVGLDSIRLDEWYQSCPDIFDLSINFLKENRRYQPLWIILCSLLRTISLDFALLQIVQSAVVNILIFSFIKKKTHYIFSSLLMYFLLAYLVFNFEIMRESLAIAVSLFAVLSFENKQWFKFLIISFIAFGIHISAIIILIFPLIYNIRIGKYHVLISLIMVLSINIFYAKYIDLIFALLSSNTDNLSNSILTYSYAGNIGNSLKYYISIYLNGFIFPVWFLFIRKKRWTEEYKYGSVILMFSIFSLLGNQSVAFLRFSNYQLIFYVILVAEIYQYALKKISPRLLTGLLFIFLMSFTFMYSMFKPVPNLYNINTYSRYYPYNSIFFKEKNVGREMWSQIEFN